MPVAAEVYRQVDEAAELSSGDIAFLSLARTRLVGEGPPGDEFDPHGRIPAYPSPQTLSLPHGREVAMDTMFALVVTHSCEIDRQKNMDLAADHRDCRLTVAPIVPEPSVSLMRADGDVDTVNWSAIERNDPAASLFLPSMDDVSTVAPGVTGAWPRAFADLRGLATVSRGQVQADRLCGITPTYLGMLQRQLARFFTWRDLARHELVQGMLGRRIADVIPLNTRGDRWRVALIADDGESVTVEIRTQ
ncbi:MAG: hypothetical protein WEC14_06985 [Chloroflexota bacterium]